MARGEMPDLIFLDLRLPVIDGYEVAKKIKSDDALRHICVILFTASTENIAEKFRDVGADDYITKPFSPEDLLAKIIKFIRS
jgi:CheY-like chemotaxis protein